MMGIKVLFGFWSLLAFTFHTPVVNTVPPCEQICGKWESSEKNLTVQVYMQNNKYFAKIVWYSNTEGKPMDYWTDRHNPNKALRSRKILGMNVLDNLYYEQKTNTWENGMVYDSTSGRVWNASAYIDKNGQLKVRGYWHFKFIGRTLTFVRVA